MSPIRIVLALVLSQAGPFVIRSARAEGARVELDYRAPAECLQQEAFRAAVASRGGRFDDPGVVARVRALVVGIQEENGKFEGFLRVEATQGASTPRRVQDSTCSEVARGLAVVAAIALGGTGSEAGAVEPAPSTAAPPGETAETSRTPSPAGRPSLDRAPANPGVEPGKRIHALGHSFLFAPGVVPAAAGKVELGRVNDYALTGGIELGILPGVALPRFGFKLQRADFVGTGSKSYLMGPILQIHGAILGPGTRRSDDGFETCAFGWNVGVGVCSALTYDMTGFAALVCADFDLGMLRLRTKLGAEEVQKRDVAFGATMVGLDLKYHLGSLFHAGLRAAGGVYFGDLRAQRPDGSHLFDKPVGGGHVTGALGVHFW